MSVPGQRFRQPACPAPPRPQTAEEPAPALALPPGPDGLAARWDTSATRASCSGRQIPAPRLGKTLPLFVLGCPVPRDGNGGVADRSCLVRALTHTLDGARQAPEILSSFSLGLSHGNWSLSPDTGIT